MALTLISPLNDAVPAQASAAPRLDTLAGKRVALLDISKPGGELLLDRFEAILRARFGVREVVRGRKPTYTKPAPAAVLQSLRGVDAVIEALAD